MTSSEWKILTWLRCVTGSVDCDVIRQKQSFSKQKFRNSAAPPDLLCTSEVLVLVMKLLLTRHSSSFSTHSFHVSTFPPLSVITLTCCNPFSWSFFVDTSLHCSLITMQTVGYSVAGFPFLACFAVKYQDVRLRLSRSIIWAAARKVQRWNIVCCSEISHEITQHLKWLSCT